ncbi:MAG: hypothetical protein ACKPEY_15425, partial [Planctomycetota bacterium]
MNISGLDDSVLDKTVRRFRARWVIPVAAPPLENGLVTVANGRIVALESTPITRDGRQYGSGEQ